MTTCFITYADKNFQRQKDNLILFVRNFCNFDKIYSFSPDDIDNNFYTSNIRILNQNRGGGYWLWKPYIINKVMNSSTDGDIIFYSDSSVIFFRNIVKIINKICTNETL